MDLFDFQRHDRYTTLYAYEPTYLDGDSDILYEKNQFQNVHVNVA